MKKIFATLLLAASFTAQAQEYKRIEGSIVNEEGNAVEFVTVGIMDKGTGTVSSASGHFSLKIPATGNDTITFSHVSYGKKEIAAKELLGSGTPLTVRMHTRELKEITVFSGKRKKAKLANRGMRVKGAKTMWTPANIGNEIGSIIESKRTFDVEEIRFRVQSNAIDSLKLSINIYRTGEETGSLANILQRPIYVNIPTSPQKQEIAIAPKEVIRLDAGRYYVSVKFVHCSEEAQKEWQDEESWDNKKRYEMSKRSIFFPLFLKAGYIRNGAVAEPERIPMNLGLEVIGYEYR